MAPSRRRTFTVDTTIFLLLLSFRILNAVTTRTFFQPDEYFQSLEPAWDLVFGNGWLTWEWHHQLRSIAHPLLFAGLYKLVAVLPISPATMESLLAVSPKLLQAFFATYGDFATAKLAGRLYGPGAGWTALWLSIGSAWNWFCSTRTFSNSLETVLTALALSLWPWEDVVMGSNGGKGVLRGYWRSLGLAAVACVLRPTGVVFWGVLGAFRIIHLKGIARKVKLMVLAAITGCAVFGVNALLDNWYYGVWTFPPITFLRFNLLHNLSVFYGGNPWHYYLSQGFPLLLTSYLPITSFALFSALLASAYRSASFQLATTVTTVTILYSTIDHKEVRFLYPLLPVLHVLLARTLHSGFEKPLRKKVLLGMVLLNAPIALYASLFHQRGVVDVVSYLAAENATDVGFLMPCHSTPWGANVGRSVSPGWWALGCEPPVGLTEEERTGYLDEADVFYQHPEAWLWSNMAAGIKEPERLVIFQQLEGTIAKVWGDGSDGETGYRACWRGFNSHVHDDWRRKGDVVVFCKTAPAQGGEKA
ncbi:hypothetical protein EX30DRAFT_314858 [Ascodesmis nigricans]|uniref:Mannosyltransferase n=1 Tax=Ascodesmis nigricans TaxID=341454 RepID=A0A4S2N8H4_9PEZI|nr:hypothetical protein EX30DRAFT_314858 [Ascodesmis nigricans]